MSLKLKQINTIKRRVVVQRATDDPDRTQEVSFVAEYRYMDRDKFDALMESEPTDKEFLEDVLVSLAEIVDESGAAVPFETARQAVTGDLGLSAATVREYVTALGDAGQKNSRKSRGH